MKESDNSGWGAQKHRSACWHLAKLASPTCHLPHSALKAKPCRLPTATQKRHLPTTSSSCHADTTRDELIAAMEVLRSTSCPLGGPRGWSRCCCERAAVYFDHAIICIEMYTYSFKFTMNYKIFNLLLPVDISPAPGQLISKFKRLVGWKNVLQLFITCFGTSSDSSVCRILLVPKNVQ